VGVPFDPSEHEAFLPLLKRGIAVCFYTLDGTVPDMTKAHPLIMTAAMQQFADADCGLSNLADAIDTVLAGSKAIDGARLAACGHSSAGTIAVAALAREGRISAAAAMAPALDVPKRLGDEAVDALSTSVTQAMFRNTPSNIQKLDKPLFIYETKDDENTPAADAVAFAQKHGATVVLKLGESGGHGGAFDDGLEPAFTFLATRLNATAKSTAAASPSPKPSAPAPF
jgi:dienelactone hydrolase